MNKELIELNKRKAPPKETDWNRIDRALSLFPEGKESFLDVGCEYGQVLIHVHGRFKKLAGVDFVRQYIDIARNKLLATYYLSDIMELEIKERFDCIYAGEIIEHMINPTKFLIKLKSLLADDGVIVFDTPNVCSINKRLKCLLGKNPQPVSAHLHTFTKKCLMDICEEAGLDVVKFTSDKVANIKSFWIHMPFNKLANHLIFKVKKSDGK